MQLFLVYYGLPIVFTALANIEKIDYVYITYGLSTAAFFSEIFRSAISSVATDQKEAAASVGLTKLQTYRRIILPQAVRIAIPATGTMIVSLLQDTSLAFSLGVIDVIGKVRALAALTYRSLEGYFVAAIIFIVLSIVLERVFAWLTKRFQFQSKAKTEVTQAGLDPEILIKNDELFNTSTTDTKDTSEDALIKTINWLQIMGKAMGIIWGKMTRTTVWNWVKPIDAAASHWSFGMADKAPRKISDREIVAVKLRTRMPIYSRLISEKRIGQLKLVATWSNKSEKSR